MEKVIDFNKEFGGINRGKPCLVMGNGPSINQYPKKVYEQFYTIGVNYIYLYDGFCPNMYLCCADTPAPYEHDAFIKNVLPYAITVGVQGKFPCDELCDLLITHSQHDLTMKSIERGYLWSRGSVVNFGLHLAVIMESDPIILIGCDGYLENQPYYFYLDQPNQPATKQVLEKNKTHSGIYQQVKHAKETLDQQGEPHVRLLSASNLSVCNDFLEKVDLNTFNHS